MAIFFILERIKEKKKKTKPSFSLSSSPLSFTLDYTKNCHCINLSHHILIMHNKPRSFALNERNKSNSSPAKSELTWNSNYLIGPRTLCWQCLNPGLFRISTIWNEIPTIHGHHKKNPKTKINQNKTTNQWKKLQTNKQKTTNPFWIVTSLPFLR